MNQPRNRSRARAFQLFALTAGGLGYCRPASGTWGSLPPVVFAGALLVGGVPHWSVNVALILFLLLGSAACLAYGDIAESLFGKKDPGAVVADEVAGQALTLLFLPWPGDVKGIATVALTGFLAFRAMDIIKPPPARGLQRLPTGLGILIDDLFAGVYAAVITQLLARFVL